jgi:hypothetical protein
MMMIIIIIIIIILDTVRVGYKWNGYKQIKIIIITIIMALRPFVGPWPLFQFLDSIHSR